MKILMYVAIGIGAYYFFTRRAQAQTKEVETKPQKATETIKAEAKKVGKTVAVGAINVALGALENVVNSW